jgi:hypothetical protein
MAFFLYKGKGTYFWGYSILNEHGHEDPHLQKRVSNKMSHVAEHVPARLGLVDAKLNSQGAKPGLSNIVQAWPIFIQGTVLCC